MVDPIISVVFVLYLISVVGLGLYAGKGLDEFGDFSVMGRSAVAPLIIATLSGTFIGAGATLSTSGTASTRGITAIITLAIPWGVALAITSYLGDSLWEIGNEIDAHTLGDAAGYFYGKPTQLMIGLLGIIMITPVLAAQLAAVGNLFSTLLPLTYTSAVIIGGAVVIIYSAVAGMRGVIITDWFQFVVLMLVIPGLAVYLTFTVGMDTVTQSVSSSTFNWLGGRSLFNLLSFIALICTAEILTPYYIGRLFSSDSSPSRRGYVAAFSTTTYMICAIGLGLLGLVILPEAAGENIIPRMLVEVLPGPIGAVGIAALFAVIMSASDSILNAAAVVIVRDFYRLFADPSDSDQLRITRIVTVVIGVLAVGGALLLPSVLGLLELGYYYWAPTVLVVVVPMILTKRQNFMPYAPPVAMFGTALFITAWFVSGTPYGLNPLFPAFIVNTVLLASTHYLSKFANLGSVSEDEIGI